MRAPVLFAVLALLSGAVTARAAEKRVTLQLTSGAEVSGMILEFDEASGLTLQRDDNGGRLPLRWHQIRPEDMEQVKRLYGFIGDEVPPVQLQALKITTATGSLIGIDEGRKDGALLLRKRDVVTPVPLESIVSVAPITVDALDVENPANVFERRKRENPPEQAVDWYNLGLLAESLTLFEQARTHFETALEVDPNFAKRAVIENKLQLLSAKEKEVEQSAQLASIRSLRFRGAYLEAMKLAQDFEQRWPTSVQLPDVQKEMRAIAKGQRATIMRSIRTDFFQFLSRAAEEQARDPEIGLGQAMTWAKEQAYGDVRLKLTDVYGIVEEQFDELWASRGASGTPIQSSYGGGTFILGDEKAKAGYDKRKTKEEEEAEAKQKKEKEDEDLSDLQKRIAQKLKERAEQQKKSAEQKEVVGQIADVPPTPEDWWKSAATKEKAAFLVSLFAEETPHVEVVSLRRRECQHCSGKGIFEFFGGATGSAAPQGSGQSDQACPRCKTLTFDRIVAFK